jgi:hypothetical protein
MRPRVYGPRSLILRITERPLSRLVTFAKEASGSQRCAAVGVTASRNSPLAVREPTRLYQAAFPNRRMPRARTRLQQAAAILPPLSATNSKFADRCSTRSQPSPADRRSWGTLQGELRGSAVGTSAFSWEMTVASPGSWNVLPSSASPDAQADGTRHARKIPSARHTRIASFPSRRASPRRAQTSCAAPKSVMLTGRGNAGPDGPSCPRRNRAGKVGASRLCRRGSRCQPGRDLYL